MNLRGKAWVEQTPDLFHLFCGILLFQFCQILVSTQTFNICRAPLITARIASLAVRTSSEVSFASRSEMPFNCAPPPVRQRPFSITSQEVLSGSSRTVL